MSVFTEYNKWASGCDSKCTTIGITPRQAIIIAAAATEAAIKDGGVYIPNALPDRTIVTEKDSDLNTLISSASPYVTWATYDHRAYRITEAGADFIKAHPEIFNGLI